MEIIRGKIPCAKKVVIYGPEGIGKSTFASRFPDPIFIDTEGSTNSMDLARFPKPTSWQMILDEVEYARSHPNEMKTLVIDTVDWAESLCIKNICDKHQKSGIEDFGYGNGYVYVKEEMGRFLNRLSEVVEAGVNVVLTAHAQIRKFEQPDELGAYDRWELKLGKKTSSQTSPLVKEWADMLLFANYKTFSVAVDDKGKKRKAQGGERVMYKDVYMTMGIEARNLHNIDIWNLRGKSVPMDKLAPKLIRRAAKKDYVAIIIDPIYKVITGDENSADQMANFCNQFDKVCTELGCAVIYCHHHSKGAQGGKKSMDRASGSGVFARDPDALLDLIELEPTEALLKQELNLPEGTVRRWKCTHKWDSERSDKITSVRKRKRGGQPGNKNATGPPGNKNAEKYGFFSKYLPDETREIFSAIDQADPLDLLWHQIQIAYAAIIRAQKIAYVRDQADKTVEKVEEKDGNVIGERWEVQQAWDKQNEFLKAQARAQGELRALIKQYDEMLHKDWESASEEQRCRIEHIRTQTERISTVNQSGDEDGVVIINDLQKRSETIGDSNSEISGSI